MQCAEWNVPWASTILSSLTPARRSKTRDFSTFLVDFYALQDVLRSSNITKQMYPPPPPPSPKDFRYFAIQDICNIEKFHLSQLSTFGKNIVIWVSGVTIDGLEGWGGDLIYFKSVFLYLKYQCSECSGVVVNFSPPTI